MRKKQYKFIFRNPLQYHEGIGVVDIPWSYETNKPDRELMMEEIKEVGYCVEYLTNKRFRWYYCSIDEEMK
jgi:hypothetical protein